LRQARRKSADNLEGFQGFSTKHGASTQASNVNSQRHIANSKLSEQAPAAKKTRNNVKVI